MEELSTEVESLLITLEGTISKELGFVSNKSNDWSISKHLNDRIETHSLVLLLTKRNLSHADRLFSMATRNGDDSDKRVKSMLKKLISFFKIYEAIYQKYIDKYDLSKILEAQNNEQDEDDKKNKSTYVADEIKFQSNITSEVTLMRETVLKIDRLSDKSKISIPLYNDRPMPFLMRNAVEMRFPEIKEAMKAKMDND